MSAKAKCQICGPRKAYSFAQLIHEPVRDWWLCEVHYVSLREYDITFGKAGWPEREK